MDVPVQTTSLPAYIADHGSRSASENSQTTPTGQPRLANVNEAYLLRHFQRHLADWVGHLFFYYPFFGSWFPGFLGSWFPIPNIQSFHC